MSTLLGGVGLSVTLPDGTPLFTDLHFHFDANRTGLIGRNGVGKSTLLRVLAGTLVPTSGQAITSKRVALLEQHTGLHAHHTVADARVSPTSRPFTRECWIWNAGSLRVETRTFLHWPGCR